MTFSVKNFSIRNKNFDGFVIKLTVRGVLPPSHRPSPVGIRVSSHWKGTINFLQGNLLMFAVTCDQPYRLLDMYNYGVY
mgnify:CR=1 FL=1